MAFNMNRPIIKGTPLHKASVAKAKAKSIVSQARTQGDAGLIAAADALGKSYKPQKIDFKLDKIDIDVPEIKKLTEEEQAAKAARKAARKAKRDAKELTPEEQAAKDAKKLARKAKRKEIGKKLVDGVITVVGGVAMIPIAIGKGLFKLGDDIVDELGNVVKDSKAKGAEGKKNRAEQKAAAEAEKLRIKAEKAATLAAIEADKKKNPVTPIDVQKIKPLPTNKNKIELQKATGTVNTTKSTDRQFDKLDKHIKEKGLDIDVNTEEGQKEYRKLYEDMTYNEEAGEWKVPHVSSDPIIDENDKHKAATNYGTSPSEMVLSNNGEIVPREGAKSEYGEVWQNGEWVDTPESEQYFGPGGEKISKEMADKLSDQQQRKSDKIQLKKEKEKALDAKNLKIRERNKNKADAKKYYGKDVKLTQPRLDAYNESIERQKAELNSTPTEILEQDDPEVGDADYNVMEHGSMEDKRKYQEQINLNSNTPKQQPSTTTKPVVEETTTTPDRKPKPSDFEGGFKEKQAQYKIANEEWYQAQQAKKGKSPMELRDNRIYRNARADGPVRRNMIKGGYTPQ